MEIAGTKTRLGVTEVRQELQLPSEGFERTDTCASADVRPNVEVTGPERHGALAARRRIGNERIAARATCRGGSG
jgi:hypothetical protein